MEGLEEFERVAGVRKQQETTPSCITSFIKKDTQEVCIVFDCENLITVIF